MQNGVAHPESGQFRTLVVGDIERWISLGHPLPRVDGLRFVDLDDVDTALLAEFQPDLILSPLMQHDYDASEIAEKLADLRYCGRYRAVSTGVPNPSLVRRDIKSIAPDVDFDLIDLPADQASLR